MAERIYLDTSVLLSAFLGPKEPHHDGSLAVLAAAQAGDFQPVISALVIAEAVGAPNIRAGQGIPRSDCRRLQNKAHEFIEGLGALYVQISERHGRRAAELSRDLDLKGKDALHLAAAAESGCAVLFSCDTGLLKAHGHVTGIQVLSPQWSRPQLPFAAEE